MPRSALHRLNIQKYKINIISSNFFFSTFSFPLASIVRNANLIALDEKGKTVHAMKKVIRKD